jgi:transcriptional regulator with XRE-family HTH domain
MIEIGQKIKKARMVRGLNQEYMAIQMGISQEAYSKIESNKTVTNYSRLNEISDLLEMSIEEILTIDEKRNVYNNIADQQHNCYFQSGLAVEKKLHEDIILEKDKRIAILEEILSMKNEEIKRLVNK